MKRLSVCIATYNGESYLQEQLKSILDQLRYDDEVIVSDDGSTDHTLTIIESFHDSRIRVLHSARPKSPVSNFEHALSHAKGEYIFLSDQDDIWFPNKVNLVLGYLKKYDLVVHDCKIQKDGRVVGSYFSDSNSGSGLIKNLLKNTFLGNCMAFRRNVLLHALPFPEDIPMHDMWIGLVATLYGKVYFIRNKLSIWRRHDHSFLNKYRLKTSVVTKLKFRIILIKSIIRLLFRKARG
ncbi:glycosyltransferase family 2 protein [Pedobacter sp. SYSU D00535]|uniref:glycosyltransferase family 2 protein n=1 Tax=Pedobacter sp. SYSU D00535 TaxID=2810308 RepID=UPI001A97B97B|nr:glycosyltransferase family 2 protein [Pedobacter sp. SYSU D00535]